MPDTGKQDEARSVSLMVPGKDPPKTPAEEEGEPYGVPAKRKSTTLGILLCNDGTPAHRESIVVVYLQPSQRMRSRKTKRRFQLKTRRYRRG